MEKDEYDKAIKMAIEENPESFTNLMKELLRPIAPTNTNNGNSNRRLARMRENTTPPVEVPSSNLIREEGSIG